MVFSPNIIIHWRLSENVGVVPRFEVSPEARKKGHGGRVVEIGANRQSCDSSIILLFKLVLEVVLGVASSPSERSKTRDRCRIPREIP
jgi:hypothetical protein